MKEYATTPTKFKEDLEVEILKGKATDETVLKTIENLIFINENLTDDAENISFGSERMENL